jgi:hypothetical protein
MLEFSFFNDEMKKYLFKYATRFSMNAFLFQKKSDPKDFFDFERSFKHAVQFNNLGTIKYLNSIEHLYSYFRIRYRCTLKIKKNSSLINLAAKEGYLKIVKFLYKNNYKFDNSVIQNAIMFGKLNVVKWIFRNNLLRHYNPKTKFTLIELACTRNNNVHIVKYLISKGILYDINIVKNNLKKIQHNDPMHLYFSKILL